MDDMVYNGASLRWHGRSAFKATSGMHGHQHARHQCVAEKGPVPEGRYYIPLIDGGTATDDGTGICRLQPSWRIERIPRGTEAGECEPFWTNWGYNRVRFEPADAATAARCKPARGGFYLHDSTKGFSHGCIEVATGFFTELRLFLTNSTARRLALSVKYGPSGSTNGGTYVR